jgi:hypothetical protein
MSPKLIKIEIQVFSYKLVIIPVWKWTQKKLIKPIYSCLVTRRQMMDVHIDLRSIRKKKYGPF